MKTNKKYAILGGGIAGLTTAIALQKIGIQATVYEAAPQLKPVGAGLALAANAIKAFQKLGIADEIIRAGRLLSAFNILDAKGNMITHADSKAIGEKYGTDNFTIHRGDLHLILLQHIPNQQVITNKKAIDFTEENGTITLHFADGTSTDTDVLIVADGIHSPIRQKLLPETKPRYAGYTCWRAVIDNPSLQLDASSESWGAGARFGIVPLTNNRIYWFACLNGEQNSQLYKNYRVADLLQHFGAFHEPIPTILHHTNDDDLLWNDIIDLKPFSYYAFGNIVLIGDAAHATTPNMGQGACQAIEDAVVLADMLEQHEQPALAFAQFEAKRLKRTHYITNTSWQLGKVAQIKNPMLIKLRNFALRSLPKSTNEQQLKKLYEVDF